MTKSESSQFADLLCGVPNLNPARLQTSTVLIAGIGNIGSSLATQLARCGLGRITLVDRDYIEAKNVCNQDFREAEIGWPKATAIAERLEREFPQTEFQAIVADLTDLPLTDFAVDIVCGALDSRRARQLLISERTWPRGVPVVDGGVGEGLQGRVQVFVPSSTTACLECTWSNADYRALSSEYPCVPGQAARGPATIAPAFIGSVIAGVMAAETLRLLAGDEPTCSYEFALDLLYRKALYSRLRRSPQCRFNHLMPAVHRM